MVFRHLAIVAMMGSTGISLRHRFAVTDELDVAHGYPYYGYAYSPAAVAGGQVAHFSPAAVAAGGLVAYPHGAVTPARIPSVAAATHAHLATKFGPFYK